MLAIHRGDQP